MSSLDRHKRAYKDGLEVLGAGFDMSSMMSGMGGGGGGGAAGGMSGADKGAMAGQIVQSAGGALSEIIKSVGAATGSGDTAKKTDAALVAAAMQADQARLAAEAKSHAETKKWMIIGALGLFGLLGTAMIVKMVRR